MNKFIVVEGNIGTGKTTLTKMLSEEYMARLVLERFTDNPFLPRFYEDQKRYAFSVELSFLADRYNQLKEQLTSPGLFSNFLISDYYFMKSLVFARVTLDDDEYRLFRQLFDIMHHQLPKPDLYVFLKSSVNRLLSNIKKRNRDFEQNISAEYLQQVDASYLEFMKQSGLPVLILELDDEIDFLQNETHYAQIKDAIFSKKYQNGINTAKILS